MGDRFYADDGAGGTVTAVIPREFAKGSLIAQIVEQDLTLDDYFGGGGNLQWNRQATNELDWLAAQCAGNRQLIPTVGNRRDSRHRHYRIGAEHDGHRKRLVGPLAPLLPQMAIGFDQNAQRVSIMNLIPIDTDVTNLAVGILADMATQGQIGSAVERVPDRYREFSQVHLIAHCYILLTHPVLDQHGRVQVFGPAVPFRGQLCRLDAERESVTAPRRQ